jgi:hypothetical protein
MEYLREFESICKTVEPMNPGTQGYSLTKKTEGQKSRETVPLNCNTTNEYFKILHTSADDYWLEDFQLYYKIGEKSF